MNYQSNYLKTVFNIIGISNIHVIAVNGSAFDGEKFQKSLDTSHQNIRNLIEEELSAETLYQADRQHL